MDRIIGLVTMIVVATVLCVISSAAAWTPPIGVPTPPFGITEVAPAVPNPWTTPRAGFYYVDESMTNSTDSGNPYGSPSLPRRTIPRILPAGAVVELHGTYTFSHASPNHILASGTAAQPVYIRGVSVAARPIATQRFIVYGSYFIVENIEWQSGDSFVISYPTTHGVARHNLLNGSGTSSDKTAFIVAAYSAAEPIDHVVVYKNVMRNHGLWTNNVGDTDAHGVAVGGFSSFIWIVDNEFAYNEGTGIQIGGGQANQAATHHIYVGRNVAHHNKQGGFSTKQSVDTIFSQNTAYAAFVSNSADGSGMGHQYAPERVWYLFNHIYDCANGISVVSDSGLGFGTRSYFIGNLIHDISSPTGFQPGSPWSQGTGMMLVSHTYRVVVGNTIYNVDNGITGAAWGNQGHIMIANNIIDRINQGAHLFLEDPTVAAASTMHHNLLGGTVRIKWGSSTVYTLAGFQTAFPGQGLHSMNANPLFVDAPAGNFRLLAASPAVDAGVLDDVYATFFNLYGIDIAKDLDGMPRPQGLNQDLGAYESGGEVSLPAPPLPATGLQVR